MTPLRLLIHGSKGRLGQTLIACIGADPELELGAAVDLGDDVAACVDAFDTAIDFSFHSATAPLAELCVQHGKSLVVGTTGHGADDLAKIRAAAEHIPVVMAPNYSVGINTLFWLARRACETLGPAFDLEVVEMHHRFKKDAPSGTAKRLAEILAEVRQLTYEKDVRHGRVGMPGERTAAEIGMHALRGGDVVGDHTVVFAAAGERVELTHRATSRDCLAKGALLAAKWLVGHPPGLHDMQDVLGLS